MAAVAGIDRWRGGWIVAETGNDGLSFLVAEAIGDIISHLAGHQVVAIDMPIALATQGRRDAEAHLRAALGSSARSVFTSPTRAAVEATTQSAATERNRANAGPGISAQAFGLFASIRELRGALAGPTFDHWWETHPETAFAIMNGGQPLASKKSAVGVAQRLAQLRTYYPTIDAVLLECPPKVPVDDALDAAAALWSAQRIANDHAKVFGPPGRDDEGFALGIRA